MQTLTTDLTVIGVHTPTPQYFWKGVELKDVTAFSATNKAGVAKISFTVKEDPVLAEMKAAGITIYREAV